MTIVAMLCPKDSRCTQGLLHFVTDLDQRQMLLLFESILTIFEAIIIF